MSLQPGQKILSTGLPGPSLIPVDTGGPTDASLPATAGTVVLNGATGVAVADTGVTAASIIMFTLKTVGGTVSPNAPNVLTITPGTGFTVAGTASDTSTYNWMRIG